MGEGRGDDDSEVVARDNELVRNCAFLVAIDTPHRDSSRSTDFRRTVVLIKDALEAFPQGSVAPTARAASDPGLGGECEKLHHGAVFQQEKGGRSQFTPFGLGAAPESSD